MIPTYKRYRKQTSITKNKKNEPVKYLFTIYLTFAPRKPKHLWLKLGAQQKNKDYEYNDQEHFN